MLHRSRKKSGYFITDDGGSFGVRSKDSKQGVDENIGRKAKDGHCTRKDI
ncbi:MAG: hypothetical protein R3B60_04850 [Candidatus Paceibacterota bacterium]